MWPWREPRASRRPRPSASTRSPTARCRSRSSDAFEDSQEGPGLPGPFFCRLRRTLGMASMTKSALLAVLALSGLLPQAEVPSYPPAAEVREAFLKMLDRPKVPADPAVLEPKTEGGF